MEELPATIFLDSALDKIDGVGSDLWQQVS